LTARRLHGTLAHAHLKVSLVSLASLRSNF